MNAIWPAIIAGLAAIIAAGLGYANRQKINESNQKLNEIHVLVNSRLDEALNQINELRSRATIVREAQDIKDSKAATKDDDNAV
jgi:hypothetical protein